MGLGGLVQRTVAFDYWSSWIPTLPVVTAILAGVGLVSVLVGDRGHRARVLLVAAVTAIPLFLMWTASRPLYDAVSLLSYIQYPWRLLGVASFFAVTLAASVFEWRGRPAAAGWVVAAALGGMIVCGAVHGIQPPPDKWFQDFTSEQIGVRDHYARGNVGLLVALQRLSIGVDHARYRRDGVARHAAADLGLPPIRGVARSHGDGGRAGAAATRNRKRRGVHGTHAADLLPRPADAPADGKLAAPAPGRPVGGRRGRSARGRPYRDRALRGKRRCAPGRPDLGHLRSDLDHGAGL